MKRIFIGLLKVGAMIPIAIGLVAILRFTVFSSIFTAMVPLFGSITIYVVYLVARGTPFFFTSTALLLLGSIIGFSASMFPYSYQASTKALRVWDMLRARDIEPALDPHVIESLDQYMKVTENSEAKNLIAKLNKNYSEYQAGRMSYVQWQDEEKKLMTQLASLGGRDETLREILHGKVKDPIEVEPPMVKAPEIKTPQPPPPPTAKSPERIVQAPPVTSEPTELDEVQRSGEFIPDVRPVDPVNEPQPEPERQKSNKVEREIREPMPWENKDISESFKNRNYQPRQPDVRTKKTWENKDPSEQFKRKQTQPTNKKKPRTPPWRSD